MDSKWGWLRCSGPRDPYPRSRAAAEAHPHYGYVLVFPISCARPESFGRHFAVCSSRLAIHRPRREVIQPSGRSGSSEMSGGTPSIQLVYSPETGHSHASSVMSIRGRPSSNSWIGLNVARIARQSGSSFEGKIGRLLTRPFQPGKWVGRHARYAAA